MLDKFQKFGKFRNLEMKFKNLEEKNGNLEKMQKFFGKKFGNLKRLKFGKNNQKLGKKFGKYLETIWKFGKYLRNFEKKSKNFGNWSEFENLEKIWKFEKIRKKFGNLGKNWKFGKLEIHNWIIDLT